MYSMLDFALLASGSCPVMSGKEGASILITGHTTFSLNVNQKRGLFKPRGDAGSLTSALLSSTKASFFLLLSFKPMWAARYPAPNCLSFLHLGRQSKRSRCQCLKTIKPHLMFLCFRLEVIVCDKNCYVSLTNFQNVIQLSCRLQQFSHDIMLDYCCNRMGNLC